MIITLNRQFGSGGREIGEKLAESLEYNYYDKSIVFEIAKRSGLNPEYVEENSESFASALQFANGPRSFSTYQQTLPMQVQIEQHNIINELGEEGNSVFVGRRADYILEEKNPFRVFVYSSNIETRVERCMIYEKKHAEEKGEKAKSPKEMEKAIHKIDEVRRKYYEMYTGAKWNNTANYNLCIDTSKIKIEDAVEIIKIAVFGAKKIK